MNVNYETKPALTFIGFHTEMKPDEGYVKCPEFWDKEYNQKYAHLWQTMTPQTPVEKALLDNVIGTYALCVDREDGFSYWIAGLYQGGDVPAGLELFTCPAGDWAVFQAQGPLPESMQTLNKAIWQEWFPQEGKAHGADGKMMVEVYSANNPQSPDYTCGIWMPVCGQS